MSEALTAFLARAKDLTDQTLIDEAVTGNVTTDLPTIGVIALGQLVSKIGREAFLEQSITGNVPPSVLDDLMERVGDEIEALETLENPTPAQLAMKALFAQLNGDMGEPCPCQGCNGDAPAVDA